MTDLAETLGGTPSTCFMRTGRIVELLGASQVVVDIGEGQLTNMPALTQYEPVLGDVVQILQQGSVNVVLGRSSPLSGDSILANPSFELDLPGSAPSYWTTVTVSGGATVKTLPATGWGSVTGTRWLQIDQTSGLLANLYVVSEAIPVLPGELWTAAGWAVNSSMDVLGGGCTIRLSWHANATDVYPTAISSEDMGYVSFPPRGVPNWALIRQLTGGGAEAPAGAAYMRVVLDAVLVGGAGSSAFWDAIVCRKLRGV